MILVFNTLSKEKAAWLAIKNGQILFYTNFSIDKGEDKTLYHLQKFLDKNDLSLRSFQAIILTIKESSLSQVKIFTNNINTLAWQLDLPVLAEYYYQEQDYLKLLLKLSKKIAKLKKFKAIKPQYKYDTQITLSKKEAKYKFS